MISVVSFNFYVFYLLFFLLNFGIKLRANRFRLGAKVCLPSLADSKNTNLLNRQTTALSVGKRTSIVCSHSVANLSTLRIYCSLLPQQFVYTSYTDRCNTRQCLSVIKELSKYIVYDTPYDCRNSPDLPLRAILVALHYSATNANEKTFICNLDLIIAAAKS